MITGQDLHWEERKEGLDEIYEFADTVQDAVADDFDEAHKRLLQWFKDLPNGPLPLSTRTTPTWIGEDCTTETTSQVRTTVKT